MKQKAMLRVTYELLAELLELDENFNIESVLSERRERMDENILVKINAKGSVKIPQSYEGYCLPIMPLEDFQKKEGD